MHLQNWIKKRINMWTIIDDKKPTFYCKFNTIYSSYMNYKIQYI